MRKLFCLLLALLTFSLFACPVGALTDAAVFTMDIDAEGWEVIIRDGNEAAFAARFGTNYDSVHNFLVSTNTYINAFSKAGNREITVRKTGVNSESVGSFENLISLSSWDKKKFAKQAGAVFEKQGGKNEFIEIYRHPQVDFLIYDMTYKPGEPDEYYGIRYYTVVNDINVYIDYYNYTEAITDNQRYEFRAIIDSIHFKDVEVRPDTPVWKIVVWCAGGVAAVGLVTAAVITVSVRAKKKRTAASLDENDAKTQTDEIPE